MKKLLIILMIIPFTLKGQIAKDKYYHAGAGVILSSGMYTIGQFSEREMNPIAPSLIAFTGGCAKELYDSMNGGYFSYNDLIWTTASGIVTNIAFKLIWKKKPKVKRDPYDLKPDLLRK